MGFAGVDCTKINIKKYCLKSGVSPRKKVKDSVYLGGVANVAHLQLKIDILFYTVYSKR